MFEEEEGLGGAEVLVVLLGHLSRLVVSFPVMGVTGDPAAELLIRHAHTMR